MKSINNLLNEFHDCFKKSHIWLFLALYEIKMRYRRTIIGPFWLTLGTAITILGMGFVWSSIFGAQVREFLPYFTVGMVLWIYMSSILVEGCYVFTSQTAIINNVKMSYFVHVMTMISRNVTIMLHNMLVVIVVFIIFAQKINFEILWIFPGMLLLLLNSFWVGLLIGIVATRYRDISSVVASVMTLIMFVTPIMWKPDMLAGSRKFIATLNPFYHMISILRDPILGHSPSLENYLFVIGVFIVGFPLTLWLYNKYISRLVFWI